MKYDLLLGTLPKKLQGDRQRKRTEGTGAMSRAGGTGRRVVLTLNNGRPTQGKVQNSGGEISRTSHTFISWMCSSAKRMPLTWTISACGI